MKTIDRILKIMETDKVRGVVAYLDEEDNASSSCNLTSIKDATFLLGALIVQISKQSTWTVKEILDVTTQAAHLLDSYRNKIDFRSDQT